MKVCLLSLTSLALSGIAAAQPSVTQSALVTVYLMYDNRRFSEESHSIDSTWTGDVLSAAPTATTYRLEHELQTFGIPQGEAQSVLTLVNGPSTYAQWRVHNGSSTYGEFCDVTASPLEYNCNVTYLGAFGGGSGYTTTNLETATNTYGSENRTFLPLVAMITDGPTLDSTPTAAPGEYADAEATASAAGAAQTSLSESASIRHDPGVFLIVGSMVAAYLTLH